MKMKTERNFYLQGNVVRTDEETTNIFQVVQKRDRRRPRERYLRKKTFEKKILLRGIIITSVIWMFVSLILLMAGRIVYSYSTRATVPNIPDGYVKEYTVIHMPAGSTVWDEASKIIDEYDMESVYRTKDLVHEIKEINNINVSRVRYGQTIAIPYLIEDTNE